MSVSMVLLKKKCRSLGTKLVYSWNIGALV